jgi:hypothetical protein
MDIIDIYREFPPTTTVNPKKKKKVSNKNKSNNKKLSVGQAHRLQFPLFH